MAPLLGLVSYICVPLVAHGRTLGALTLVAAESGRRFDESDLAFAQDLAHRAALAVDNARSYREAQAARHLVELHGGTVRATSGGEGQGSTFSVLLPVMIVHAHPEDRRAHHTDTPALQIPSLAGLRVLAVDDDADALGLMREILEGAGAKVTTVSSAAGALNELDGNRPDVILADIGMPNMDGYELMTRIRRSSDPALREIPAASLTGYARSEDRVKSLQSGFRMHLSKPIDPAELVTAVAALAGRNVL